MEVLQQLGTYYSQNGAYVLQEFYRHFLMSVYGVLFAAIVGVPLGIFIARHRTLSGWVFAVTNVIQTVPALAMLAVLMLVMGLGANTVILSLFYIRFFRSSGIRTRESPALNTLILNREKRWA